MWGALCRGRVGHAGVGWGGSSKGGVGHVGEGWGGLCRGWVSESCRGRGGLCRGRGVGSCRGGMDHAGVEWDVKKFTGKFDLSQVRCSVFSSEKLLSTAF